jgi:valyl-tRNA synthetase
METAGDLVFFWVARMIMLGLYVTGEIPFRTVYYHGMVLDAKGQKMSKSKGNVIDPLTLTEKYGTDAFRIGMVVGNTPGTSLALAEERIRGYKNFANKIWNAARFVLENTKDFNEKEEIKIENEHQEYINEWNNLASEITKEMDEYKFYIVAEKLYHYFWHTFADVIIEDMKGQLLASGDPSRGKGVAVFHSKEAHGKVESAKYTLFYLLKEQLKALHPFMPFITEEIWSMLPENRGLLMIEKWPS